MQQSLMVLGREKNLCLAELKSLFDDQANLFNQDLATINLKHQDVNLDNLGGSIKLAEVIVKKSSQKANQIEELINLSCQIIEKHFQTTTKKKINLGLSFYGFKISTQKIKKIQFSIKHYFKQKSFNLRFIPNDQLDLSSAQIYHNQLTKNYNLELIFGLNDQNLIIARTHQIQDFNAYTDRDRNRPKRDSRVGMLPPKLAQIIINLATGPNLLNQKTILDPFCGTGVLLQEALIKGYRVIGSDLMTKMIDYSKINLDWITRQKSIPHPSIQLIQADATSYHWQQSFDFVASETYLGLPFTNQIDDKVFMENKNTCDLIIKKFLINLRGQINSQTRICLAVPCWERKNQIISLDLIDDLTSIGYNQLKFTSINDRLIYKRPDQIVGRELLILKKSVKE